MPPLHPKTELLEYFIKVGDGSRPVFQSVEMFDEKETDLRLLNMQMLGC